MSAPCTLFEKCNCVSCQAAPATTPLDEGNRPGLPALRYRVGTFSTFRQAMLDYLTLHPVANRDPANPAVEFTLGSRSSDDYGIAMLELWAYVCDVLTFYGQAIANEAYLRTATQPASVMRLAALLGYRPAPAVAASVYLAYEAAKNSTAIVPAGLQTQSDPQPGQTPAIYEDSAELNVDAALNRPALLGPQIPLRLNRAGLLVIDDAQTPLSKGARLLFFNTGTGFLSEQQVDSVTKAPAGKTVTWRGDLGGVDAAVPVYRVGRVFRCFGANAPATYYTLTTQDGNNVFTSQSTKYCLPNDVNAYSPLSLDGVYSGIGAGARIVIQYAGKVILDSIGWAGNGSIAVGPLSGSATRITLNANTIPAGTDIRGITVYELLGEQLHFSAIGFDSSAGAIYAAGAQSINVLDASGIGKGGVLLLAANDPVAGVVGDVVTASAAPQPIPHAGATVGYTVAFTPALSRNYTVANTAVYGNIALATQGKTQSPAVLGSGDASQAWQEFSLKSKPVTYVPDPAGEGGASSTLQVFVNSIEWAEVDSFYGQGPTDRIFVTRTGDDGTVYVQFGDGVTGQRLPTGDGNVTARNRAGAGSNGNAAANTITQMLRSVTNIQSVTNPLPAFGGSDGEPLSQTRENAPVSVLTLGRAVSLRDYEALALTFHGIAKARASWADAGDRRGVSLTVDTAGSQPLGPLCQPLLDFLDDRRDPNVPLSINGATRVRFVFRAKLHLVNGYLQSAVKLAAENAIGSTGDTGLLSYAQLQIGESIFQSQLIAALQDVDGVDWVEVIEFSTATVSQGVGFYNPLPRHLLPRKFLLPHPASKVDVVYISPQQIAWPSLDDAGAFGVGLTLTGGVDDLQ